VKAYDDIGIAIPEVCLPRAGTDLEKWAVIACDQFTSEPQYWKRVDAKVGDSPSTLHLVFPEVYLEQPGKEERIRSIQKAMQDYLSQGLMQSREGMLYIERRVDGRKRQGLMLCLDLDRYDYSRGSGSLIRATEGTIVDRLPPRMAIRQGAALELPHILVLIDDPDRTVIEPIEADPADRALLYDFDLMFDSGHLTGSGISEAAQGRAVAALQALAAPQAFKSKYGLRDEGPVLLFAVGDGNHSLATAKAVWEQLKPHVAPDHPARYALVEVENVHDEGLHFEPIHRVLFGVKQDLIGALKDGFEGAVRFTPIPSASQMVAEVEAAQDKTQVIGIVQGAPSQYGTVEFLRPTSSLAVGTLQDWLDRFVKCGGAEKVDYVHGGATVQDLGSQAGNAGFHLPRMEKSALFKAVILDGALPRKTFSMGEAREKRFYMEARRIN
jgi:Protein of unknown function (DUF1015)